ncbi:MAG: DUF6485 family protein [bacterium]
MECKTAKNIQNCTCSYDGCSRKGICCECVAYHRSKQEIPGCFFPLDAEKSWDRSVKNFVNSYK